MAVSSSPQDERFATLRQLIRSGEIGHVADADAALFQTLVQEAVAIAGISGDPIVNGEPVICYNPDKWGAVHICNLYSITTNQAAIAGLFRHMNRYVGNLAPMPGVFPDYPDR